MPATRGAEHGSNICSTAATAATAAAATRQQQQHLLQPARETCVRTGLRQQQQACK